jgi:hypothetical protein
MAPLTETLEGIWNVTLTGATPNLAVEGQERADTLPSEIAV